MKLTVLSRLMLGKIFPQTEGILQQSMIRDISKKIEFSQEEIKKLDLKIKEGMIKWNPNKEFTVDVDFSETELSFLRDCVDKMDREKTITQNMLEVCLLIKSSNK